MTSPKRVAEVAEQLQHLHAALHALIEYGEYQLAEHHLSEPCAYCEEMRTEILLGQFAERKANNESHLKAAEDAHQTKRDKVAQWAPLGARIEEK